MQKSAYTGRPSDRVRAHLEELRRSLKPQETLRIPPVRQLARDLKVSKATIYHVFKDLSADGGLSTAVGRGSFLKGADDKITIGLSWPSRTAHPFTRISMITHALFNATMDCDTRVELKPIPREAFKSDTQKAFIFKEADEVDALIYGSSMREFEGLRETIRKSYEERGKPVVLLDAPDLSATRNFVAPDVFAMTRHIARVWAETGRRHIAFLMKDSVNATVTTLHALTGLKSGMALGGDKDQRVGHIFCRQVSEEAGYDGVMDYLAKHKEAPDAVYCFGDRMAWGAMTAFREKGLDVPEEVSVIGGTGFGADYPPFGKFSHGNLTRVRFSFETIAQELLEMTIQRVRNNGLNIPGVYVPGTMIEGATTRSVENEALSGTTPADVGQVLEETSI